MGVRWLSGLVLLREAYKLHGSKLDWLILLKLAPVTNLTISILTILMETQFCGLKPFFKEVL